MRQISLSTRLMTVVFWRISRLTERKPKVSTSQRTGRTRVAAMETEWPEMPSSRVASKKVAFPDSARRLRRARQGP